MPGAKRIADASGRVGGKDGGTAGRRHVYGEGEKEVRPGQEMREQRGCHIAGDVSARKVEHGERVDFSN